MQSSQNNNRRPKSNEGSQNQYGNFEWIQENVNQKNDNSNSQIGNNRYVNQYQVNSGENYGNQSSLENENGRQTLSDEIIKDFEELEENEAGENQNYGNEYEQDKSQNQFSYGNQSNNIHQGQFEEQIYEKYIQNNDQYQDQQHQLSLPFQRDDQQEARSQYHHQRMQSSQNSQQYPQENQDLHGTIGPSSYQKDDFGASSQQFVKQNPNVNSSRMTSITKIEQNMFYPNINEKTKSFHDSQLLLDIQQQNLKLKENQLENRYKELKQFAISNLGFQINNQISEYQYNMQQNSQREKMGDFSDEVVMDDDTILKSNDNLSGLNSKFQKIQLRHLHPPQSEKHGKYKLKQNKVYSDNGDVQQQASLNEFTDNYTQQTQNISTNNQIITKNLQRGRSQNYDKANKYSSEIAVEGAQIFDNLNSSVKTDIEQGDPIICYSQTKGGPRDLGKEEVFFNMYNQQNNRLTQSQASQIENSNYDQGQTPRQIHKLFQENEDDQRANLRSSIINQNSEDAYKHTQMFQSQNGNDQKVQTISSQQSVNTQQKNLTIKLFIKAQNAKNEQQNKKQKEADETPLFASNTFQNMNSSEKFSNQKSLLDKDKIEDAYDSMKNLVPSSQDQDRQQSQNLRAQDFTLNYNSVNTQKQNQEIQRTEESGLKSKYFEGMNQNMNKTVFNNILIRKSSSQERHNIKNIGMYYKKQYDLNLSSKFGQRLMSSSNSNNSGNKVAAYAQSLIRNNSNSLERKQDFQPETLFTAARKLIVQQEQPCDIFKTQGVQPAFTSQLQIKNDKDYCQSKERYGFLFQPNSSNTRESKELQNYNQFSSRAAVVPNTFTDRDRPITYYTQMTYEGAITSPNYLNNDISNRYSWRAEKNYVYDKPISTEGQSQDVTQQYYLNKNDQEKQNSIKDSQSIRGNSIKQYFYKNKGARESHSNEGQINSVDLKPSEKRINYKMHSPVANSLNLNNYIRSSSLQKKRFEELHNSGLALLKKTSALVKNPHLIAPAYNNQKQITLPEIEENESGEKDIIKLQKVQTSNKQAESKYYNKIKDNTTIISRKKFILRMFQKNLGQSTENYKNEVDQDRYRNMNDKQNYLYQKMNSQDIKEPIYQNSYKNEIDRLFQDDKIKQYTKSYNSKERIHYDQQRSASLDDKLLKSDKQNFIRVESSKQVAIPDKQQDNQYESNYLRHGRKKSIADEKIDKIKHAASKINKGNQIKSNITSNYKESNDYPGSVGDIGKGLQTQLTSIDSKSSQCNSKIQRLKQFEKDQDQEKQRIKLLEVANNNSQFYKAQEQRSLKRNESDYRNLRSLSAKHSYYLDNLNKNQSFPKGHFVYSSQKNPDFDQKYRNPNLTNIRETSNGQVSQRQIRQQSLERQDQRLKEIEELEYQNKILDDQMHNKNYRHQSKILDQGHQIREQSPKHLYQKYEQYNDPYIQIQNSNGLHQTLDSHKNSNFTLGNKKYKKQGNQSIRNSSSSLSRESPNRVNGFERQPIHSFQSNLYQAPNIIVAKNQPLRQKNILNKSQQNIYQKNADREISHERVEINYIDNQRNHNLASTIKSKNAFQQLEIPDVIHKNNNVRYSQEIRGQYHNNANDFEIQNRERMNYQKTQERQRSFHNQVNPRERSNGSNISRPDMLPCKGPSVISDQFNDSSNMNQVDRIKDVDSKILTQTYGNQFNFSNQLQPNLYQQTNLMSSIQFSDNQDLNSHAKFLQAKQDENSLFKNLQDSDMFNRFMLQKKQQFHQSNYAHQRSEQQILQNQSNSNQFDDLHLQNQMSGINEDSKQFIQNIQNREKRDLSPVSLADMTLKSSFGQKQVLYAKIDHRQSNHKKQLFEIQEQESQKQNESLLDHLEKTFNEKQLRDENLINNNYHNDQSIQYNFNQSSTYKQQQTKSLESISSEQIDNCDQKEGGQEYSDNQIKQKSITSKKYISSAEHKHSTFPVESGSQELPAYIFQQDNVSQFQQNEKNDVQNCNPQSVFNRVTLNSSQQNTIPFLFGSSQLQKAIYAGQLTNSQQIFLENASEYFKFMLLNQLKLNTNQFSNFQDQDKILNQEQKQLLEKFSESQISQSIEQIINHSRNFSNTKIEDQGYKTGSSKSSLLQQNQSQSQISRIQKSTSVKSLAFKKQKKEQACQVSNLDQKQSRSSLKSIQQSQNQKGFDQQSKQIKSQSQKSIQQNIEREASSQKENRNLKELQKMWDSINPNKGEYDVRNLINMQFQQAQMLMDLQQQLLKVKQIEDSNLDSESSKLRNADSIDILQNQYLHRQHLGSVSESQSQRPPKPLDQNKKSLHKDLELQIQEVKIGSATDSRKRKSNQKQIVQDLIKEQKQIQSFDKNLNFQNPLIESNRQINLQNQVFSKRSDNSVKSKLSHTCLSNISQQKASTLSLIQKIYQQMEKIDQHIESKEKVDLERYSKMERRMNRLFQKYSKIKEENLKIQMLAEQEVINSQSICTSELRFNDTNQNSEMVEQSSNKNSHQRQNHRSSKDEPKVNNQQSQINKRQNVQKQEKDIEKIDIAIAGAESTLYSQNFIQMDLNNNFQNKKQNNKIEMVNSKHISKKSSQNGNKIEILEYSGQNLKIKTKDLINKESQNDYQRQSLTNKRELKSEYESTSSLQNGIEQSESLKSKTYAGISNCGSMIEGQLKINAASDNSIVNYHKANDFANQQMLQQTQSINQIHNSHVFDQISANQLQSQLQSNNYNLQQAHQNQLNQRSIQISQNQNHQQELNQNSLNQDQYQNNTVQLLLNQNEKKQNEMVNQLIQPLNSNQIELEYQVQQMNKSIEILKNEHLNQIDQMKQFYAEQLSKIREEVKVAASINHQKSYKEQPRAIDTPANIPNSKSQDNFMNLTNLTMSASDQNQNRKQEVFINPNQLTSHSFQQEDTIDQKVHLQEKQKNIAQEKSQLLEQDSKQVQKQRAIQENFENETEIQAQQKAQEAINKLMDQRKFTDTIEQLNQAVQQKEQLEQKLQRIKDKIQMAKSIKQKQGQQESQKQRKSVQSQSKSRYDNCGESAEIKTSDIYLMVKNNELSDEQTQSVVSGSYRQQIQVNPKTEKASCRHNSSQNLLINQSDTINQQIKSHQATTPPIFNDHTDQQSRFFLESSFVQNNQSINNEEEKRNDSKQEQQKQNFQQNNKIERTSAFSGDFGLSMNYMQKSEHRQQSVSQSFEDIVNQQSAPHLVNQDTSNSQLVQNKIHSSLSSQMHQISQDFNQLQQNSSQDLNQMNNNGNSLIKIDQQHSAYQQYLVANRSAIGSTLLNQNSEQQSQHDKNRQLNLHVQIQPFADPTFSNHSSSNQNSQNQILSQSQSNLSFQKANNQLANYVQKENYDINQNLFNQQRFSNNNLNLQQINQNLKAASLNEKFAKPFVPAKQKQNMDINKVELNQQFLNQPQIKDADNSDKILDIYLENTSLNQEQNGITISNQMQYNKLNNENRRGIYQKIVDLQQQQNNNYPYKNHIYLNGHLNTQVGTVTSSQQNIDHFAQANNGSFQSSQSNTLMIQDNACTHSQQKDKNSDSQIQNAHYQMNFKNNCNPLRKSPIRQAIGSGPAVNTNNSIVLPMSASVDYSLSQTNYGTISDNYNKQLTSLPKSISNSLHQHDRQEYITGKQQSFSYNQDQQFKNQNSFNYPESKTNFGYQIQDSQNLVSKHMQNLQQLGNSQLFKSPVPMPIVHNYGQLQQNNQLKHQVQQINNSQTFYQPQNKVYQAQNNPQTQNIKSNEHFPYSQQQYFKIIEKDQKNSNMNEYKQGVILNNANINNANLNSMNRQSVQVHSNQGIRISNQSNYQPKSDGNNQLINQMNSIKSNQTDLRSGVFSFSQTQNVNEMKQNLQRTNQVKIENDNTPKQLKVQQLESENASYTLNSRTIEDDFTSSQRSTSKMTSEVMNSDFSLKY